MATNPIDPTPTPDIPPVIEPTPTTPNPAGPDTDIPDLHDDPPPETVNLSQDEDEGEQAQTFADAALGRGSYDEGLGESTKVRTGDPDDDVQDLVDHMHEMDASGRIDMDAYRGERNDDDEEGSLGPAGARA